MATYYPSSSNQGDILPIPYPRDTKLASYPELPLLPGNVMMYLNQASSAGSYSEILSGNALSPRNCVEIPSVGSRNEAVFIPPMGQSVGMQSIGGQSNTATGDPMRNSVSGDPQMVPRTQLGILDGEHNLQCQGLSLSLGTRMPSVVPVPSFQYQYTNPGLSSCLSTHLPVSGEGGGRTISCKGDEGSQSKELRNAEYLASDIFGADHVAVKARALNNSQCSISPKEMHSDPYVYEPSGLARTIFNSKYLKAAQQLLDEVINVRKALKQHASDKHQNFHNFGLDGFKETDGRSNSHSMLPSMNGLSSNPHESNKNSSCELSPVERQGLQDKKRKLLSMLDEVDIRYKQYYHQMQIVVSSFNMVAGCGAAKPYTALALQTISRHFRCFRDAISGQIQVTRRSLGEQDSSPNGQGVGISRLRYVGQQLGQQRALQQLGMTRHAWRPQRGLPESSVSILRAWLFEHFLHPYPKDSEKIMLARQTGLTRSQVANWYINARVRLWKPMVEEMYKEEFGNSEMNSESSPENAPKAARDYSGASDNRGEEFQESLTSTAADSGHPGPFHDSKFDIIPGVAMSGPTEKLGFQNGAHGDDDTDCEVIKLQGDQRPNVYDHSNYPDEIIPPNQNGDGSLMVAAATYHMSELGDFAVGSQVSLALGLRHCETDVLSMSGGTHFRGENTVASSMGPNTADYHCMDPGNQLSQRLRFGNPHQLHDFEA